MWRCAVSCHLYPISFCPPIHARGIRVHWHVCVCVLIVINAAVVAFYASVGEPYVVVTLRVLLYRFRSLGKILFYLSEQ